MGGSHVFNSFGSIPDLLFIGSVTRELSYPCSLYTEDVINIEAIQEYTWYLLILNYFK